MEAGWVRHRRLTRGGVMAAVLAASLLLSGAALRAADPAQTKPLVWVVDGAGDLRGCSTSLMKSFPDQVEFKTFSWSHGHRRIVADQADYKHARRQGELLAEAIQERQKKEPGRRVVVVAHSAGAAVGLAAAEKLEKNAIDRLVLLAPSVASSYDPLPAAKACKEGMDVFTSSKDIWALGIGIKLVGTTDVKRAGTAAGKNGFDLKDAAPNIRTHAWAKDDAKLGHNGGHYGAYTPEYAKKHLLPILFGKDVR
jgi:alpha-beta hydrolase superfamily lysophospholipase